jgi:hypothetical protein
MLAINMTSYAILDQIFSLDYLTILEEGFWYKNDYIVNDLLVVMEEGFLQI